MGTPSDLEEFLTEHDVARLTSMPVASVRRWRLINVGPRATKLGSVVRYRPSDVREWLDSRPTIGWRKTEEK